MLCDNAFRRACIIFCQPFTPENLFSPSRLNSINIHEPLSKGQPNHINLCIWGQPITPRSSLIRKVKWSRKLPLEVNDKIGEMEERKERKKDIMSYHNDAHLPRLASPEVFFLALSRDPFYPRKIASHKALHSIRRAWKSRRIVDFWGHR